MNFFKKLFIAILCFGNIVNLSSMNNDNSIYQRMSPKGRNKIEKQANIFAENIYETLLSNLHSNIVDLNCSNDFIAHKQDIINEFSSSFIDFSKSLHSKIFDSINTSEKIKTSDGKLTLEFVSTDLAGKVYERIGGKKNMIEDRNFEKIKPLLFKISEESIKDLILANKATNFKAWIYDGSKFLIGGIFIPLTAFKYGSNYVYQVPKAAISMVRDNDPVVRSEGKAILGFYISIMVVGGIVIKVIYKIIVPSAKALKAPIKTYCSALCSPFLSRCWNGIKWGLGFGNKEHAE